MFMAYHCNLNNLLKSSNSNCNIVGFTYFPVYRVTFFIKIGTPRLLWFNHNPVIFRFVTDSTMIPYIFNSISIAF